MSLKDCKVSDLKAGRTTLNSQAKFLNDSRLQAERIYMAPFNDFKVKANELRDILQDAAYSLGEQIKEAEDYQKQAKRERIREYYEGIAGLLVPLVPLEKILDQSWLNKTNKVNYETEIDNIVKKISDDWNTLKGMDLAFKDEAESTFFSTLDLGSAIARNSLLIKDKERRENMVREIQEAKAEREKVEAKPLEQEKLTVEQPDLAVEKPKFSDRPLTWQLTITCTPSQLNTLKAALQELDIHGTVKAVG
jgi:hypothetical protein